jgi:murein DD-endopeptidase MepM/ murein hydrolase activator NlpD
MEPTKFKVITQQGNLTIRKQPNGELTGLSAPKGSIVVVTEQKNGWSRIAEGWVSSKFLSKADDTVVVTEPDAPLKFTHQPIIFPDPDHLILRTAGLATPEGAKFGMTRKDAKGKPKPHQGIDLEVPPGEPIFAVEKGTIVDSRFSKDYGTVLCLRADEGALKGKFFFYAHLNKVDVKIGDKVEAGDVLGLTGSTGNAKSMTTIRLGSHLHFEGRTIMQAGLGLGGRFDPLPLIRLK